MKRVLVFGASYNPGGIENFLINYVKRFDNRVRIDYVNQDTKPLAFEKEIKEKGGKIVPLILPPRKKHPIKYLKKLNAFFKKNHKIYDVVWFNYVNLTNIDAIKVAAKFNVKKIIIHAHNSKIDEGNFLKKAIKNIQQFYGKYHIAKIATDFWACSESAAKWFYPGSIQDKTKIIKNAINLQNYTFSEEKRESIRKKYNLRTNYVIGNVGRLAYQKNQFFAIQVINTMIKDGYGVKLVLVGDGQDKEKLKQLVSDLGIESKIIFAGVQKDIQAYLSAFDLFIFPSHFEGLGMAAVEAEANGLPVIASKFVIPQEIKINKNVDFLDLHKGYRDWANYLEQKMDYLSRESENEVNNNFQVSGYDIKKEYLNLEEKLLSNE